jgi:release factor glutamine methyltransferase
MVAHLDAMVARYLAGEPLAYVLGRWSFRHVDLAVDRRVLIPRPETEVVAGVAIDLARALPRPIVVADLGTGSGAIGLSLADELPVDGITVWLTDASDDALDLARANLAGLGRRAANVRVAGGHWFDALPTGTSLDLVVSNPPYVASAGDVAPSVVAWEPHEALFAGADGLDDIRAIVGAAPGWLRPGGWLVLEIGADQGDAVERLLRGRGYSDVAIQPDLAGRDRVAVARLPH